MNHDTKKCTYDLILRDESLAVMPNIFITNEVLDKMHMYARCTEKEVGWIGYCKHDKDENKYIIYDTELLEQKVTSVTTDIAESAIVELAERLISENPDMYDDVRVWGHSHVNMQVNPSGTDDETFEQFYKNCDYFIRIIVNKKDDLHIDFVDCENGIQFNNVEWHEAYVDKETQQDADKLEEAKRKVLELEAQIKEKKENKFNELEEKVKLEIEEKCREKYSASKYKVPNISEYRTYSYYDLDGYGDYDTLELYDKKKTNQTIDLDSVLVYKGTNEESYEPLYNILQPYEIETIALQMYQDASYDIEDMKIDLSHIWQFNNYTKEDWLALYDIIEYCAFD